MLGKCPLYIYTYAQLGPRISSLKEGSRATLILYNFLGRTIKIGILPPEPLRVLRAETTFDASSLQVEVDKDFLEKVCLPGLEAYQNSQSDPEPEVCSCKQWTSWLLKVCSWSQCTLGAADRFGRDCG